MLLRINGIFNPGNITENTLQWRHSLSSSRRLNYDVILLQRKKLVRNNISELDRILIVTTPDMATREFVYTLKDTLPYTVSYPEL